ncbi:MAG: SagB/ThcOx family dehydrogenase [bacterium]
MNSLVFIIVLIVLVCVGGYLTIWAINKSKERDRVEKLPQVLFRGNISLEQAIKDRRSVRTYAPDPLTLSQISQLVWACQGITGSHNLRAAPSAGGLYPLEIYVVAGKVDGFVPAIYKYRPAKHDLFRLINGDQRAELSQAALGQACVLDAPISLVVCGVQARLTAKYGQRARQYMDMEVGCVAQNAYLQATVLGLGTVFVGAFDDDRVKKVLNLTEDEVPLCILPVGKI